MDPNVYELVPQPGKQQKEGMVMKAMAKGEMGRIQRHFYKQRGWDANFNTCPFLLLPSPAAFPTAVEGILNSHVNFRFGRCIRREQVGKFHFGILSALKVLQQYGLCFLEWLERPFLIVFYCFVFWALADRTMPMFIKFISTDTSLWRIYRKTTDYFQSVCVHGPSKYLNHKVLPFNKAWTVEFASTHFLKWPKQEEKEENQETNPFSGIFFFPGRVSMGKICVGDMTETAQELNFYILATYLMLTRR